MGFFSWKTQDTNRSVISEYVDYKPKSKHTRNAYLMDNKGNIWGSKYDGYGRFGLDEKDYYELLAEMNGKSSRDEGLNLAFGVNAIVNKKTKKIYKGSSIDFRHWTEDILENGMSASQLIESGEWERITLKKDNILHPNIVESPKKWEYINEKPEDCEHQGFFIP